MAGPALSGAVARVGRLRSVARPLAVVAVLAALAAAGCGGSGADSGPAATTAAEGAASEPGQVRITDFEFGPPSLVVRAGTKVTWTNNDRASHTATASDGEFDTGTLDEGDAKAVEFDEPGTYAYVCQFHPFMKGTVEVTD